MEDQAQHPIVNPVEMGLANHDPVLKIVRTDPEYVARFRKVFNKEPAQVTMKEVQQAIASFERTIVSGDSPFDRWYFGGDQKAVSDQAKRGFDVFLNKGRCVSCHAIEQDQALFTDNRFHNIGVGINRIQNEVPQFAPAFLKAKATGADVDKAVLANPKASELGRFAVTETLDEIGAVQDLDAAQRRRDRAVHARRQPEDAARRGRALQQRRHHEEERSGERFPERRHSPAESHRRGDLPIWSRSWNR